MCQWACPMAAIANGSSRLTLLLSQDGSGRLFLFLFTHGRSRRRRLSGRICHRSIKRWWSTEQVCVESKQAWERIVFERYLWRFVRCLRPSDCPARTLK